MFKILRNDKNDTLFVQKQQIKCRFFDYYKITLCECNARLIFYRKVNLFVVHFPVDDAYYVNRLFVSFCAIVQNIVTYNYLTNAFVLQIFISDKRSEQREKSCVVYV